MAWDRKPSFCRRPALNHRNSTSSIRSIRPQIGHRDSTSSIYAHPKRDSFDADIARRDATAAAQYAYARAEERKSLSGTDMGLGNAPGLSRGNSTASNSAVTVRRSDSTRFVEHGGVCPPGSAGLKRQQSVRFAGPNAIPRRKSLVRLQSQDQVRTQQRPLGHTRGKGGSISAQRPRALTVEGAVPAGYRPPSRSSSIGKSSLRRSNANRKGGSESFVAALAESAVYDEYYAITREDDVASTPSSYRRIRKSKSMFSPGKTKSVMSAAKDRGSIQYDNGTPSPEGMRRSHSFLNRGAAGLKFQQSMSFLRGGRDRQRTSTSKDNDAAVAMARDKFLHHVEQQRLREQPSFLFRANKRREEHTKSSEPYSKFSSEDQRSSIKEEEEPEEMKTLKGKARKASKSFRKKLKGLFKRSSDDTKEASTIPDQQVTAYETHVVGTSLFHSGASDVSQGTPYHDIPCPTPNKIYSVAARTGSLHAIPSAQQLRSRTGSVQSLHSDASGTASNCSKSRVTSWTSTNYTNDSVITGTSRHAQLQLERERQRLSIIQENGTHVSSCSFRRPPLRNQFSAYPLVERGDGPITQPVDSQRVYSALMKRLDENSPQTEGGKQVQKRYSQESFEVPARNSSIGSGHHGESHKAVGQAKDTPATIRAVPPSVTDLTSTNGEFKPCSPNECDDVFSPAKDNDINAHRRKASGSVSSQCTLILKKPTYSPFPVREPGDDGTFYTPQQIADRIEGGRPTSWKEAGKPSAVLKESKSTFFPRSGASTIQRTKSPYRLALAGSDYRPDWKTDYSPPTAIKANRPAVQAVSPTLPVEPIEDNVPRNSGHTIYSDSIYSRTTGEEGADVSDEDKPDRRGSGSGTAVLMEREVYRPTHRPSPFQPQPNHISHSFASSGGSIEWKKWMSAEVAALERIQEPETAMRITYALPSMPRAYDGGSTSETTSARSSIGHVREKAQISDDDTSVRQGKAEGPKQPVGILQSLQQGGGGANSYSLRVPPVPPKSILKKTSQSSIATIFADAPNMPVPPVPPLPARMPLRQTQSRTSMRSVSSAATARIGGGNNGYGNPGASEYNTTARQFLNAKKSNATLKSVDTFMTKKLVKKSSVLSRKNLSAAAAANEKGPSPGGLGIAVDKQFGVIAGGRSASVQGVADENVNPTVRRFQAQVQGLIHHGQAAREPEDAVRRGVRERQDGDDRQVVGSKRMVDLFLSSRRRRMAGSEESGPAFL